jgi:diketogulonate reductase-like aldo/keto reductase
MLPIPGTSSIAHLEGNIQAASLQLSENEYLELTNWDYGVGFLSRVRFAWIATRITHASVLPSNRRRPTECSQTRTPV